MAAGGRKRSPGLSEWAGEAESLQVSEGNESTNRQYESLRCKRDTIQFKVLRRLCVRWGLRERRAMDH